jgi:putative ubiquitin-RnfH superfamily antitoxin RatB of RatAB toxin-antitoxin module
MVTTNYVTAQVAFATVDKQVLIPVRIKENTTILAAIEQSNISAHFPNIALHAHKVGVFSQIKSFDDVVHDGDRIEIYRELLIDPKDARKKREIKRVFKKRPSKRRI